MLRAIQIQDTRQRQQSAEGQTPDSLPEQFARSSSLARLLEEVYSELSTHPPLTSSRNAGHLQRNDGSATGAAAFRAKDLLVNDWLPLTLRLTSADDSDEMPDGEHSDQEMTAGGSSDAMRAQKWQLWRRRRHLL